MNNKKNNNKKNTTLFILGFLALISLLTALVLADSDPPLGVREINQGASSRLNTTLYPHAILNNVMAGNITEINLTAISATKAWAGYYGEITGTLTLEDANGYVFYNWSAMEPKGEVYASIADSITWSSIACFSWSGTPDIETVESWYGIEDDDADGINETFTSLSSGFYVGTEPLINCPATHPFVLGVAGAHTNFENILLTDGAALIFAAIIENNDANNATDIIGYDGRTHDFQLLVAENGHDGEEDNPTTYYFWAEIE